MTTEDLLGAVLAYLRHESGWIPLHDVLLDANLVQEAESLRTQEVGPKVFIRFQDVLGRWPDMVLGPCRWFQMTYGILRWSVDDGDTDVAGRNRDGTWDARPADDQNTARGYTDFVIYPAMAEGDRDEQSLRGKVAGRGPT